MKKKSTSQSAFFNLRVLLGFTLSFLGVALAIFAGWGMRAAQSGRSEPDWRSGGASRRSPLVTCLCQARNVQDEAAGLAQLEQYWNDRLTLSYRAL